MMGVSATATDTRITDTALRIHEVLERCAAPQQEQRRDDRQIARSFPALIHLLARKIDETVLPRCLSLCAEGRVVARIVVSNRRLVGIETNGQMVEVEAGAGPEDVARTYAQALLDLHAQHAALALRPAGRAPQTTSSCTSCSARRLSGFADGASLESRIRRFLKLVTERSHGWIFRPCDEEAIAHDPDPAIFKQLLELEEQARAHATDDRFPARVGRPEPTCSALALTHDIQAIIASDGKNVLTLAVAASDLTPVLDHWQGIFGSDRHRRGL